MKALLLFLAVLYWDACCFADVWDIPKNAAHELPPGVPRAVDTNGTVVSIDYDFTTPQYHQEALRLVLEEANQVAKDLNLTNELPITESNILEFYVGPFGYNYTRQCVGNVTTRNYIYYISRGNKFSFLEGTHQFEDCVEYKKHYLWPTNKMDMQLAYQQAAEWLTAAHMDIAALNQHCDVIVLPEDVYIHSPPGKFVPVYCVYWKPKNGESLGDAEVRLFTPTKKLLSLHVEDAKYILRKPLVFTNLAALFPGVAPVITNYPKAPIWINDPRPL